MEKLIIYNPSGSVLTKVSKWEFSDTYMGEQYISFTLNSEVPVEWSVGCYCTYRGQRYTLNYIPGVTQRARSYESGDAFVYDSVKFESPAEELTRIVMLDITASTGDYVETLGTNYTGSSQFQLFCGETVVEGLTRTAVCVLAGKIYANIIRANADWRIFIDLTSTHLVNGVPVLNTHTDDKNLSFDNTTVREALEMVHSEFDLDFAISGRNIYIGYSLGHLSEDKNREEFFYFGYGRGMAGFNNEGKALYEIRKNSDSGQKIITRLRAIGSTKNMPYRYYNKKYNLPQALYPANLQLPDTFADHDTKERNNDSRQELYPDVRRVLGQTNDAYIDKNDDAEHCPEGIREHSARWDGSNQDLEEIYPTIKETTYGQLRAANCADMDDSYNAEGVPALRPGASAFPRYDNTERIDEIADFDYRTNLGDGFLAENVTDQQGVEKRQLTSLQQETAIVIGPAPWNSDHELYERIELFSLPVQPVGSYILTPALGRVFFEFLSLGSNVTLKMGYRLYVLDASGQSLLKRNGTTVPYYQSKTATTYTGGFESVPLEALPDVKNGEDSLATSIEISTPTSVRVFYTPYWESITVNGSSRSSVPESVQINYRIGLSTEQRTEPDKYISEFVWKMQDSASTYMNTPFTLYLKDLGIQELQSCFNASSAPVIAMTSGMCVGREFQIATDVPEKVTVNGRRYWKVQCSRAGDQSLQTYYPSSASPIAKGDTYVLLNVSMPESYIKAAEARLLIAASEYLADNCNTRYIYEPHLDDIYLRREYDDWLKRGAPEKSIYWNLYAGYKFPFYGIPESESQRPEDVLVDITIQQITIKEGEGDTPKVEITLNDEVSSSTIKKLTTAVDRIYSGGLFSGGSGSAASITEMRNIVRQYGRSLFLSKEFDDTAEGKISFKQGAEFGSGASINEEGDAEFHSIVTDSEQSREVNNGESLVGNGYLRTTDMGGLAHIYTDFLTVRMRMTAAELDIHKISYSGGNRVASPAGNTIEHVKELFDTEGNVIGYRCYIKADDGEENLGKNEWHVGDQARCQTFNLADYSAGNRYYWRLVTQVGIVHILTNEEGNPTYEETDNNLTSNRRKYLFVDLSDLRTLMLTKPDGTPYTLNDDGVTNISLFYGKDSSSNIAPTEGDTIVCMGSQIMPKERGNIIIESTADENAPSYAMYHGVGNGRSADTCYTLAKHMTALLSPKQWYVNAETFKWTHDGVDDALPPSIHRGDYDPNATYFAGDTVNYHNALWQCITPNEEGISGIAPAEGQHWTCLTPGTYKVEVIPVGGDSVIRNGQGKVTLQAYAYRGVEDITDVLDVKCFNWLRDSGDEEADEVWNSKHVGVGSTIIVTANEVSGSAIFQCLLVSTDEHPEEELYALMDSEGYFIIDSDGYLLEVNE